MAREKMQLREYCWLQYINQTTYRAQEEQEIVAEGDYGLITKKESYFGPMKD